MKRLGNIWAQITSDENIELAFQLAIQKTKNRQQYLPYKKRIVSQVKNVFKTRNYSLFCKYNRFIMYEPKERIVHFPGEFATNVIHKCILNVIGPRIIKYILPISYANIKNRGAHKAVHKLQSFARTHREWYYFKGDVKKFFDTIPHDILKQKIRHLIKDPNTLEILDALVDSYEVTSGCGIPIGNHTSPYLANLFLADIGHEMCEHYHVPFIAMYMDDIVCCFETKEECTKFRHWYTQKLVENKLELKNNYRIDKLSHGIDFLGYVIFPTHTKIRKRIKKSINVKTQKCMKLSDADFKLQMASYWGWCKHANCKNLLKKYWGNRKKLFEKD